MLRLLPSTRFLLGSGLALAIAAFATVNLAAESTPDSAARLRTQPATVNSATPSVQLGKGIANWPGRHAGGESEFQALERSARAELPKDELLGVLFSGRLAGQDVVIFKTPAGADELLIRSYKREAGEQWDLVASEVRKEADSRPLRVIQEQTTGDTVYIASPFTRQVSKGGETLALKNGLFVLPGSPKASDAVQVLLQYDDGSEEEVRP